MLDSENTSGNWGGGRWMLLAFAGLSFSLLAYGVFTRLNDGESDPRTDPADTRQATQTGSGQERSSLANNMFNNAKSSEYHSKIRGFSEVAHVFWDTDAGPEAYKLLVFYLMDDPGRDYARAYREVLSFGRQRPETIQYYTTCNIFCLGLITRIEVDGHDSQELVELLEKGRGILADVTRRFAANPEYASDARLLVDFGESLKTAGDIEGAMRIFQRVSVLDPPAAPFRRFDALVRQADLLRGRLNRPKEALEIYRRALTLTPELDLDVAEKWGGYVEEAVRDLEGG